MANPTKIKTVHKPILPGSWHGKDTLKLALKRCLAMLAILLVFYLSAFIATVDSLVIRIAIAVLVLGAVWYFTYAQGATQGESDTAFGEILYTRNEQGKPISKAEKDRSFHALKGFAAVLLGMLPFLILAIIFACKAKLELYTLGVLPSWTGDLLTRDEFADALGYYALARTGLSAYDILRIIMRGTIMPFVSVAVSFGSKATLLCDRLSPLLILLAPMGYGFGYAQGQKMRDRVNTSIKLGVEKKKKKQRREHKQRMQKKPEQLI